VIGIAMVSTLYEAGLDTLTKLVSSENRQAINLITLGGGFVLEQFHFLQHPA
jgi:hypothetical protein